jgi:60 kDa SS-A/Ro ribonucleoprotein
VTLYWMDNKQPLSAGAKRGLARAFKKFDAYQLAKYNRDAAMELRDVLFLCHAKPQDAEQAAVWKKLVENTLEPPDTWEVALSAGKDKRENFERLLREGKLGGLAVLRNLRLMLTSGVEPAWIRERLDKGVVRALPFRFVTAARHAPKLEDAIEKAMLKGIAGLGKLEGSSGLIVDVSGSMNYRLSKKGETTRMDAAAGLAILLREKALRRDVFGRLRRAGAATRIRVAGRHRGLAGPLGHVPKARAGKPALEGRLARVGTHHRAHRRAVARRHPAYVDAEGIRGEPGPIQNGVSYGNGWTHVDGWWERIVDYIAAAEAEAAA